MKNKPYDYSTFNISYGLLWNELYCKYEENLQGLITDELLLCIYAHFVNKNFDNDLLYIKSVCK
jgi:hypothetical protein